MGTSVLPEGVIYRGRDRRMVVQVSLGKDPVTGKRQRRQFTAAPCDKHPGGAVRTCRGCQHLARDLRAAKVNELATKTFVPGASITLGEWLDHFLDAHEARRRKNTVRGYRTKLDTIIRPRIGHVPLQKVDAVLLEGFYARLLHGDEIRPRGYAGATVRQVHAIIHRGLKDAVRPRGTYLLFNPAAGIELPTAEDGDDADVVQVMQVWTAEQLRAFLAHAAKDPDHAWFHTASITGMRRSELCGLRWDMVDLDRAIIRVERARHEIDKEVVWAPPKSKKSRRVIELSSGQMGVLREHRKAQAAQRLKMGEAWVDNDLVFAHEDGTPPRPDHYTRRFAALARGAKVPVIRLHDLRHTHATLLLEAGRPVLEVSTRLGHSTTAFTMDVYGHVTERMRSATADALDAILGG